MSVAEQKAHYQLGVILQEIHLGGLQIQPYQPCIQFNNHHIYSQLISQTEFHYLIDRQIIDLSLNKISALEENQIADQQIVECTTLQRLPNLKLFTIFGNKLGEEQESEYRVSQDLAKAHLQNMLAVMKQTSSKLEKILIEGNPLTTYIDKKDVIRIAVEIIGDSLQVVDNQSVQ
ncbi:UNKNOWN [Stylonychia lemnae]|uniref:Uncharacterized protein n=1 Tax=Stylonychia lemnae TaxID=5949 RepID=A0A078AU98_STYLE|nr:UNKNOWN [Stylonychia lemnae]|eukprot:CDW84812.1 UNKNOWN [Stylonychia lemnae]